MNSTTGLALMSSVTRAADAPAPCVAGAAAAAPGALMRGAKSGCDENAAAAEGRTAAAPRRTKLSTPRAERETCAMAATRL